MWKQRYRRAFIPNQLIILFACSVLWTHFQMPFDGITIFFVVMQLGALFGAMWTARLMGKFDRNRDLKLL